MSLRGLALLSGLYDLVLGASMLFLTPTMARIFGAPPPVPVVNAQLNGMFALTLALGYFWAAQDVEARRGYLWVAGVFAKTLGPLIFLWDHFAQGSPAAFLAFAAMDGSLAVATVIALRRRRGVSDTPTRARS